MLPPGEREEIRQLIYAELADLENRVVHDAGSYNYVCCLGGAPVFTHNPIGRVLRQIGH